MNSCIKLKYNEDLLKSLKSYKNIYIKYIENKIEKSKFNIFKNNIEQIVPEEVVRCLEFFIELDMEFPNHINSLMKELESYKLFSPKYFTDKKWEGFWLKATGMDADIFINWLYSSITYDKYQIHDIEYWFLDSHPNEKYLPHSIKKANEIFKKYYLK